MKRCIIFLLLTFFIFVGAPISFADPVNEAQPDLTTTSTPKDFSDDACDPTTNKDCYQLLESIPLEGRTIDSINTKASGSEGGIGGFINFMFEMGIGVAGVLGVIMLVIYGFRYASNDKNINEFSKLKEKIGNVILGLLLLLSIFIILNTINPDLLVVEPEMAKVGLDIKTVSENYTIFNPITGVTTKIPKGGKVQIEQLCPIATIASQRTGLDKYFILAILWQETSFGSNIGSCNYRDSMSPSNISVFEKMMNLVGKDPNSVVVSCKSSGSSYGGAMGVAQITPETWVENEPAAKRYFATEVTDPWNITHSIYMGSTILSTKKPGGSEYDKACAYFGSCSRKNYGSEVLSWKAGLVKEDKCKNL